MKHKVWIYVVALLVVGLVVFAAVQVPRLLFEHNRKQLLEQTRLAPLTSLPEEKPPEPLSQEEQLLRAAEWYARENQSAQFVNRVDDVTPSSDELSEEAITERFYEQIKLLSCLNQNPQRDDFQVDYYRLVHGVTQEYQGFYCVKYMDDDKRPVVFYLDANTGTVLNAEFPVSGFVAQDVVIDFASIWHMEDGEIIQWRQLEAYKRETMLYANGGASHISIVIAQQTDPTDGLVCHVTLRPGTGANQ
ncbi:MAG: hypothetical protein RR232_03070 [Clostridia bacterium]